MTRERRFELLDILSKVQNEPHNQNKDIMTITGFMKTEEEILQHIENHKLQPSKRHEEKLSLSSILGDYLLNG
jgi:hypothetical protein